MRTSIFVALVAILVLALQAVAQDDASDQTQAGDSAEQTEPASEPESGDGDAGDPRDDDVDFVVSEEIPAETELVFPVDI